MKCLILTIRILFLNWFKLQLTTLRKYTHKARAKSRANFLVFPSYFMVKWMSCEFDSTLYDNWTNL